MVALSFGNTVTTIVKLIIKIMKEMVFIAIAFLLALSLLTLWAPELRNSILRWSDAQIHTIIFSFQKRALKSEIESGIFGTIIEDTIGYDESFAPTSTIITKGTKTMAVDLKGRPRSINSERVLSVMLPNQFGDFVKGKIVLVPSKKIVWNKPL